MVSFCIVKHARIPTYAAELEFSEDDESDDNYGTPTRPHAIVTFDKEDVSPALPPALPPDAEDTDDDDEEVVPPPPSTSVPLPAKGDVDASTM